MMRCPYLGKHLAKEQQQERNRYNLDQEYRPEIEVQAGYPAIDEYVGDEDDTDVDEAVADEHRCQQHFGLIEQVDNAPVSRLFFCFKYVDILMGKREKSDLGSGEQKGEHEQQDYQEDKYRGSCGGYG